MRRVECFFSALEQGFSSIKRRRVHPEELERRHREESAQRKQRVLPVLEAPRECKTPAPEPARHNAAQRVGGSQRGYPIEREILYSVYNW